MPFQKGKPRSPNAGRKKGTPNKRKTIFDSLDEIVTEDGQPVDVIKLLFDGMMTMPPYQRVDALLELAKFLYPRQNNVQLSNPEGEGFRVIVEDYVTKKP